MLLQSLMGVSDEEIIDDYHRSDWTMRAAPSPAAAANSAAYGTPAAWAPVRGRLDKSIFSGASRQDMVDTLRFVRGRYGSVVPGYLDAIGFDESWRARLVAGLTHSGG
jgi:hypothetical protein